MSKDFSVLIVDDEEPIRELLAECLRDKYRCMTARNASEASALLSTHHFNLLLTDLEMPGGSGFELCKLVKNLGSNTVVVVVSGMTHINYAIEAIKHGAFDYLAKPFTIEGVRQAIDRAAHHQMLMEAKRNYEESLEETIRVRNQELRELNDTLNNTLEELYINYRETLRALACAQEARGDAAQGHTERVVAYCLRLGKELNLSGKELLTLEQGALLHDIGMLELPDSILKHSGALSPDQRLEMRRHIERSLQIISKMDFLKGAQAIVGQHHENYDGSGYPHGLQGEEIHLYARILAVADAFDAMTSNRPYRPAQSYSYAQLEIVSQSGKQFDPQVVQAFLNVAESEWKEISAAAQSLNYLETYIDKREIRSFIVSLKKRTGSTGNLPVRTLIETSYSGKLN
jgi:response regulator RpfG family c-di-GMP phosphodiesterase